MAEKSRLLLFTTSFLPLLGGSEIALDEICRRLPEFEFDVITGRLNKDLSKNEKRGNFNIHRVGSAISFLLPKAFLPLAIFFEALRLNRRHHYRTIHAYQASQAAGGAWLFKLTHPKVRFILTLQEGKDLARQGFLTNLFRTLLIYSADEITAISSYLADYARRINPKAKITIIPNGVDTEVYKPLENKEIKTDRTIISVSRLVPKNGLRYLIEALSLIQDPVLKLWLIGSGPEENNLKELVKEKELSERVEFKGSLPPRESAELLKKANLFVRPSLSEGLGTAFLEAMACGVPIIGTPVGGIPDFLKDRETGIMARPADAKDLAEKIDLVLSDAELRQKITKNGWELVLEKYTWPKIAADFKEIYERS